MRKAMARKRLGKGLDALLGVSSGAQEVVELKLEELRPGRHQPRERMEDGRLRELAASLKETGVLQPVIARRDSEDGGYEIVMGERRWRAAKLAGLKTLPVVVREVADRDVLVLALAENLQREDLNPIEKARAFKTLIDSLGVTQTQAAQRLGMGRAALSNTLRLLELPSQVKGMVAAGKITAGHARALLMVKEPARIRSLAKRIVAEGLSVRQVEEIASGRSRGKKGAKPGRRAKAPQIIAVERELSELLGTKVRVEKGAKGGRLVVNFYSADDFEQIVSVLRKGAGGSRQRT
jgi:ParB family chromosome partitioning protein